LTPVSNDVEEPMSPLKPADTQDPKIDSLLGELGELIRQARQKVLRAVDTIQVQTCWQIGRHIVEFEQEGAQRAGYGKQLIGLVAKDLTAQFGKGLTLPTCVICASFIKRFQFVTHCVTN
jgi:hypothetical protein